MRSLETRAVAMLSTSRISSLIAPVIARFSPMYLSSEERKTIHGVNERISVEQINKSVEFYLRLIRKL